MIDLQPHPAAAIAAALFEQLPLLDWSEALEVLSANQADWKLVAVPELSLVELQGDLQVLICPQSLTSAPHGRHSTMDQPVVDVCLRANCAPHDTDRLWNLLSLTFTIGRTILESGKVAGFQPMSVKNEPIYDVLTLRSLNEFRGIQSVQFRGLLEI